MQVSRVPTGSGPIGYLTLRCRVVVKLTSQNTVDWPGVGLKKKKEIPAPN